jgi:hypothetical protein
MIITYIQQKGKCSLGSSSLCGVYKSIKRLVSSTNFRAPKEKATKQGQSILLGWNKMTSSFLTSSGGGAFTPMEWAPFPRNFRSDTVNNPKYCAFTFFFLRFLLSRLAAAYLFVWQSWMPAIVWLPGWVEGRKSWFSVIHWGGCLEQRYVGSIRTWTNQGNQPSFTQAGHAPLRRKM